MNKRSEYLDCLRGIVMLMVVFSHTCGEFCLNCKDFFGLIVFSPLLCFQDFSL